MSVGRTPPPKADVDANAANILLSCNSVMARVADFKAWMDTQSDANLISLGYSQAEVNTLRSAFVDASLMQQIWVGSAGLATPRDMRTFAKLVWGIGIG